MEEDTKDICRVCRAEGSEAKPLFYPCRCAGSIKYVHEECLWQWIDYTKRETCELCLHPYTITSVFAPDTPNRLPLKDVCKKVFNNVKKMLGLILRILLVAVFPWLFVTPVLVCRLRRILFYQSSSNSSYFDIFSIEDLAKDAGHGLFNILCTTIMVTSTCCIIEQIDLNEPRWLRHAPVAQNVRTVNFEPAQVNNAAIVAPGLANNVAEGNIFLPNRQLRNPRTATEILAEIRANIENQRAANVANANGQQDNANRINRGFRFGRTVWGNNSVSSMLFFAVINAFVVFLFEYIPCRVGTFALNIVNFERVDSLHQLEHIFTLFCGYCLIGFLFYLLHMRPYSRNFQKLLWGYCYLVVKVSVLTVVEFGIFPAMCGCWLNVCSLPLLNSTIKDLTISYTKAPLRQMFFFWLYGVVYFYISNWFEQMLRGILRPGTLWFLRNWKGLDYNPINEMIKYPLYVHIRRFLLTCSIFGTLILLGIWVPSKLVKCLWPDFLPYQFSLKEYSSWLEALSIQTLLKNILLSAALHNVFGFCTKIFWLTRKWCYTMAQLLGIHSFLLGELCIEDLINNPDLKEQLAELFPEVNFGFPAEDIYEANNESSASPSIGETNSTDVVQEDPKVVATRWRRMKAQVVSINMAFARLRLNDPMREQPYLKTRRIYAKVSILLISFCVSLTSLGIFVVTVPVAAGRFVLKYWIQSFDDPVHDLTAFILGTFVIRCTSSSLTFIVTHVPILRKNTWNVLKNCAVPIGKAIIATPLIIGIIPYLTGLLYLMFINAQLQATRSPLYVPEVIWLMGIWLVRAIYEIVLLCPQHNWLRRAFDRIYTNGFRNINLTFIMRALFIPSIVNLGLALAVPYVIGNSIMPLLILNLNTRNLTYWVLAAFLVLCKTVPTLRRVSRKIFARIADNRPNRIGRRLVNYERPDTTS